MIKPNPRFVYLLKSFDEYGDPIFKIGITKNSPEKRVKQLQTGNGSEIILIDSFWSEYSTTLEKALHNYFDHMRKGGEWFSLDEQTVKSFNSLCVKCESNFKMLFKSSSYLKSIDY